eukprot:c7970_g1_i2.p1 GENE.c7970_g1_i2~~c7970_g1_i2.p1  ORF type:complete len:222 (+),score=87.65 c7970_g1_i2:24-668(+)
MSYPKLKLTYFKSEGRAEKIRLAFVIGKVPFEDHRITTEWPQVKASAKFGQAPLLEVDGVQYAQSGALLRYAGRLAGLYPSDSLHALRVDEVIALTEDLSSAFSGMYAIRGNSSLSDEEKKTQLEAFFAKVAAETLPKYFAFFDTLLAANGTNGYLVGDSVTLADVVVYTLLRAVVEQHVPIPKSSLDAHPLILAHYNKIAEIPEVKAWYSQTH